MTVMADATKLKEEGNKHFKEGNFDQALSCYTEALKLNPSAGSETAVYYKNRAACYLKANRFSDVVSDCTNALNITPNDPKALFRRCQAFEGMSKYDEAFRDAMQIRQVDPKNMAIQPILQRLNPIIQDKITELNSTDSKVNQMFDLAFGDADGDMEKKISAANNLIVLARDEAGAEKIFRGGGIRRLLDLIQNAPTTELQITAIRVLACVSKGSKIRAEAIYHQVGLREICIYMGQDHDLISAAMSNVLRNIINTITELDKIKDERDAHEAKRKKEVDSRMRPFGLVCEKIGPEGIQLMDEVFPALIKMLGHAKVSMYGRDNALELIIKYVPRREGCGWPAKFVNAGGLATVLEVASTIVEHKTLKVSPHSRSHSALALQKVWDELFSDKERDEYRERVNEFFTELFSDELLESKLEAVMALSALLQGPYEVGGTVLGREGVLEMILAMADSGNATHVKYAVEALVYSASKRERCGGVIKQATPILKQLYQSQNDSIKVRALVGLCKLGSFGGSDVSAKTFADGSNTILAKACRKFLCNTSKDVDFHKWAAEGLSYLTLDADVKEELVDDTDAIKSLVELAKVKDKQMLYPIATIFVNVTNSLDKKEVEPELLQIAKFAKQHVPEDHEKDKEPFISERVKKLVSAGIVNALVNLTDCDSDSSKELLARVYLSVTRDREHHGLVVQQGGAKALIPLSVSGTDRSKIIASHALAKIAITNNPEIAFPGQRSCEVVRPILQLLHPERTAIENFEALMALTNLSSMNDTIRRRIVKEGGLTGIEHYCYEEHELLRRAATECICNLVMLEEVAKTFKGENDRLKMLVLFSGEDDIKLVIASIGAIAMLSSDPEICHKITKSTPQWSEILAVLAASEEAAIQHRAVYVLRNMLYADKELAQMMVEGPLFELLMAISQKSEPSAAKTCAEEALAKAVEWELIKPNKLLK